MLSPYMLVLIFLDPDCWILLNVTRLTSCGHSFCGSCLENIFAKTLQHWISTNEEVIEVTKHAPYVKTILPVYRCPLCRHIVSVRPTRNHALKSLITEISRGLGKMVSEEEPDTIFGNFFEPCQ